MRALHTFIGGAALAVGLSSAALTGCDDPARGAARAAAAEPIATSTSQSATVDSAAAPGAIRYVFDQSASKISWVGSKVTGKHEGGFGAFRGTVDVSGGAPEASRVDVQIDVDSIASDAAKLTRHLTSPDFFDAKAHPKASFVSTQIKRGGDKGASHTVTGNLTVKGITKSVTFPATIQVTGDTASLDAQFAINRREFSLNYPGMPNDLIRDDVLVTLVVRAKKG